MKNLIYKKNIKCGKSGFATFEILLAMALIISVITVILPLLAGEQSLTIASETDQEATYKAKELLENARAASVLDFNSVASIPIGPDTDPFYNKSLDVEDIDSFTKKVTSNVSWNNGSQNLSVNLTTLLTQVNIGGDTCNPVLTGDWTDPQKLGSVDVGESNGATDVDVISKKAYLTSIPNANNKPNFYIVDVSDPNNLIPKGSIDTNGPSNKVGLAAVHVAGRYAYVANMSLSSQLQVIDISDPDNPIEIVGARRDVVTLPGDTAVGNSIFYANRKIYLGLEKSAGPEFYVFDVTDPESPTQLGTGFEVNTLISQIYVKDDVAYIATPDDFDTAFPSTEHLRILDVSNPASISEISIYGESNTAIQDGKSLFYKDGIVYLGRASDDDTRDELIVLDVNNPSSITKLGGKSIDDSPRAWSANAIVIRSNFAFIVTRDNPNSEFQVWDITNPTNITLHNDDPPQQPLNVVQASTGGMDCDGNLFYIAQRSNDALQIVGPGE